MSEFVVAGLLTSPFVKYALLAALIFIPIRFVLVVARLRMQLLSWNFANRDMEKQSSVITLCFNQHRRASRE